MHEIRERPERLKEVVSELEAYFKETKTHLDNLIKSLEEYQDKVQGGIAQVRIKHLPSNLESWGSWPSEIEEQVNIIHSKMGEELTLARTKGFPEESLDELQEAARELMVVKRLANEELQQEIHTLQIKPQDLSQMYGIEHILFQALQRSKSSAVHLNVEARIIERQYVILMQWVGDERLEQNKESIERLIEIELMQLNDGWQASFALKSGKTKKKKLKSFHVPSLPKKELYCVIKKQRKGRARNLIEFKIFFDSWTNLFIISSSDSKEREYFSYPNLNSLIFDIHRILDQRLYGS